MSSLSPTNPPSRRIICAWCGGEMSPGPVDQTSHGICPACAATHFALPVLTIGDGANGDAPCLPYGRFTLDDEDRVVGFEASPAIAGGYRRDDVLGRAFFRDILPDAEDPNIAGWIRRRRSARHSAGRQLQVILALPDRRRLTALELHVDGTSGEATIEIRDLEAPAEPAPTAVLHAAPETDAT